MRGLPARWGITDYPGDDTGGSAGVKLSSSVAFAHRASSTSTLHGHRLELDWSMVAYLDGSVELPVHDPMDRIERMAQHRATMDAVAPLMRPVVEALVDVVLPYWHRCTILERRDPVYRALVSTTVEHGTVGGLDRVRGLPWWPTLDRLARHFTVHLAECCRGMDVDVVGCDWRAEDGLRGAIDVDPFRTKPQHGS